MAELRVSELSTAASLDDSDLLLLSQVDENSQTGYASAKTTNVALATKVAKQTNFSDLQTTSKNIIGAINEISGAASSLVDLNDVDITTPADGECLQYNGTSQKWENKDILAVNETTLTEPYVYKQVPNGKYTEKLKKLIGASVVWNQLADNNSAPTSRNGLTITRGSDGFTVDGTAAATVNATSWFKLGQSYDSYLNTNGHKVLISFTLVSGTVSSADNVKFYYDSSSSYNLGTETIIIPSIDSSAKSTFTVINGTQLTNAKLRLKCFDLTAMFGSTIADYVYSLEQATKGSGIAWLKKYGFFTEEYYTYSANTIQSVSVSAHVTKDSNDQTLTTTTLDHTTLRGLFKLDANNNLYADGDIYNADGSEDVKYEERAYASGDESLPDTITDGTTTVTKKVTPTTAALTPFNPLSVIEQGGTEEFVDYGVQQGTRDVAIPCGNESVYGDNRLMAQIIKYINS